MTKEIKFKITRKVAHLASDFLSAPQIGVEAYNIVAGLVDDNESVKIVDFQTEGDGLKQTSTVTLSNISQEDLGEVCEALGKIEGISFFIPKP